MMITIIRWLDDDKNYLNWIIGNAIEMFGYIPMQYWDECDKVALNI